MEKIIKNFTKVRLRYTHKELNSRKVISSTSKEYQICLVVFIFKTLSSEHCNNFLTDFASLVLFQATPYTEAKVTFEKR